ncbi:putative sugar transporter [Naematelia encephala]|uniref:Putative sugar transporter n=1 Tax=Naematelia encephala TaxID=71784 RepID=A0A1Y2BM43_9TREE|nr:putative sugar transporter [Naematelia encephala]
MTDVGLEKAQPVVMKSRLDKMSVWRAALVYKRVWGICMAAAFSASLDGYQINLNGSIISNTGFIHKMFGDVKASPSQYVSAWGGLQSAGQCVGQILLQFATDRFGRKVAMYITWLMLVISIAIESITIHWWQWLIAKFFSGLGVGMMQATIPMYISEHSPTQLRGFFINSYTFWFVVGQLLAPVALREMNARDPTNFRVPIYTQWAMIGILIVIYIFMPESPWWLVSKGKLDQAEKILHSSNGHIEGYVVREEVAIMVATVEEEKRITELNRTQSIFAILWGTDGWRLLIACWPKVMQQFVGLTVFNTYATYFFQLAGNKNPFTVTVILACVQLMSVILVATTTDSFGRRPLTVYGYAITTVSVLCLGIVGCFDYTSASLGSLLIFFACLATFSTSGASAIGYAYLAEIPTQRLRARTSGWGLAISNLFGILFSFTVPLMLNGSAHWNVKTGFFFAATGTIVTVIGWFILPEVARRTPAEIDEMFEKKVSPRKFGKYVTDVQMALDERERVAAHSSS